MQRRPVALVAALASIVLGLFLLWHKLGSAPTVSREVDPTATRSEQVEKPIPPSRLDASASSETEGARADALRSASELAARTETFALADATWIQGTIRFPEGSPEDDSLEAWAFEDSVARALSPSENDLPDAVRTGRLEKGWWSRRPIDAAGAFRLPIPKGVSSAAVVVNGRFLYLARAGRVDLAAGNPALVLEPKLGAWLVGRCILPPDVKPEDAPVGATVAFIGADNSALGRGADSTGSSRSTAVGPDLAFELRGVPTDLTSWLSVVPERLVAAFRSDLALLPGKRCDVEFVLILGARVSGRVVDEAGTEIAGARVELAPGSVSPGAMAMMERTFREVTTGEDGSFELLGIRPGETRITAEKEGFVRGRTDSLPLTDGEARNGISIVLPLGQRVAGKVSWPDGTPATGAAVHATAEASPQDGRFHLPDDYLAKMGTTGDRGEFTISGLGSGPFTLTAIAHRALADQAPGENLPAWTAEFEGVAAGTEDVALVLREPIGFAGNVVDDQGAPVKSFAITASPDAEAGSRAQIVLKTTTFEAADGSFFLTGLQPGRWRIAAKAKGYVQVDEPIVEVPRVEGPLVVVLPRAASASGLVVGPDGQPIAGADVIQATGENFGMFVDLKETPAAKTDELGGFTIGELPPGPVDLLASAEGFARSEPAHLQLVAAQKLEGIVIQLRRGGRLTGEVFNSDGGQGVGRQIMVMSIGVQEAREAKVDAQGLFAVENLAPGAYQVIAEPTQSEQEAMAPKDGEKVDPSAIFATLKVTTAQIREGETTHVILGAPPKAPVRVFGRVTRAGEPMRSGTIVCVGEGGSLLSKLKMAQVREGGDYELKLDEPGAVVLSYQRDVEAGGTSEFHVTIPEKPEFRVDLDVPTGGLRGTIRGPDGSPLAGIGVSLLRHGGFSSISAMDQGGNKTSDQTGRFEFGDLAPGTYGLAAGGGGSMPDDEKVATWGRVVVNGLRVEPNKIPADVEIRLSKPGSITGLVRDADGSPVVGATIFVRDERGETLHQFSGVVTDASGHFTYRGISAGRYILCARTKTLASPESAPVSVHEGGSAEVELAAGPGTTLLISVEDKDGATLHAGFSVRDEHGHDVSEMYDMGNVEGILTEGLSSTQSRIGPLPPGEYKVTATTFDGRSASKPVKLSGQEERRIKLRIE